MYILLKMKVFILKFFSSLLTEAANKPELASSDALRQKADRTENNTWKRVQTEDCKTIFHPPKTKMMQLQAEMSVLHHCHWSDLPRYKSPGFGLNYLFSYKV